jgi:FdhE protein
VASDFFRRLLGGRKPPPPAVAEAVAELDELARARPALTAPAVLLRDLLPELLADAQNALSIPLTTEGAHAKLAAGVPLLRGEDLSAVRKDLGTRMLTVCKVIERHQAADAAAVLAAAVRTEAIEPAILLSEVLAGRPEAVHARAEALGLDASLVATALRLAALPMLAGIAAEFEPLRQDAGWERGYCPVCGSWPLLGEFRGLEQTRHLRCGWCASAWAFARLRCPFCDTRDHRHLAYIHADGEQDRYRAATCDACHGFVKMVTSLSALPLPLLLVKDVATLHLDLAAADRGFFVP